MSRVVIIGGSGHVGTYLVPRLVEAGFEVCNVTRGQRRPYAQHGAWKAVQTVVIDREAEEKAGTFGRALRNLKADIIVDMICFLPDSARQMVEALNGHVGHVLTCGTIWVHGPSVAVPTTEAQPRRPFGDYGVRKAAIEAYLIDEARRNRFPATVLHPGHIVGEGWAPLNPAGHFDLEVFSVLARGKELALPNLGMETVHHVHADDVAQAFMKAIANWRVSVGEAFHVVSPAAVTLRGYAEAVAGWFGRDPKLVYLPWEEWKAAHTEQEAAATWDHIAHSPSCSIDKSRRLLGYEPRYTSFEAVLESVKWLVAKGMIRTGGTEA